MTEAERCLRKLYLQDSFDPPTHLPYQFDQRLFATEAGVGVALWISCEDVGEKLARRAVFTTLEENGIPSDILDYDALVYNLGTGPYTNENQNQGQKFPVGKVILGKLHCFMFPFHEANSRVWFVTEDDVVSTRLTLISR